MNKFEYILTMKELSRSIPLIIKNEKSRRNEYFTWNNIKISFNTDTIYAVVEGKIPYEVAQTIYDKYPTNKYKINIDGGREDNKPIDYAVDEKYNEEIKSCRFPDYSAKELDEFFKKIERNLRNRKNDKKFIEYYHVNTKEGLIILLNEINNYYIKKNNLPIKIQDVDAIKENLYKNIIKEFDPTIDNEQWIEGIKEGERLYYLVKEKLYKSEIGKQLINYLCQFDQAINPFSNNQNGSDINYNNITIQGESYNERDIEKCGKLEIKNSNGIIVTIIRNKYGFSYQILKRESNNDFLIVDHKFYCDKLYSEKAGEFIEVSIQKGDSRINMKYDLLNNTISETYGIKRNITPSEQLWFNKKLEEATNLALSLASDYIVSSNKQLTKK